MLSLMRTVTMNNRKDINAFRTSVYDKFADLAFIYNDAVRLFDKLTDASAEQYESFSDKLGSYTSKANDYRGSFNKQAESAIASERRSLEAGMDHIMSKVNL